MRKLAVVKLTGEHPYTCDICADSRTLAVIDITGGGLWAPTLCLCEEHSRVLVTKLDEMLKSKKEVS